jgi:hypothetical protein
MQGCQQNLRETTRLSQGNKAIISLKNYLLEREIMIAGPCSVAFAINSLACLNLDRDLFLHIPRLAMPRRGLMQGPDAEFKADLSQAG